MQTEYMDIRKKYTARENRKKKILALSILVLIAAEFYFVTAGYSDTDTIQVFKAVIAGIFGKLDCGSREQNAAYKIIILMRMPRVAMAVIAGAGLSIAGTSMQAVTRNQLVSPFTMGISSAAAFGASMCIVFGSGLFWGQEIGIISSAFIASAFCVMLVYIISLKSGMKAETIVLTGIALNYFFSALSSAIEFFAKENKLSSIVQWTFGTFNGIVWKDVLISGIITLIGIAAVVLKSHELNVMSYGDDEVAVGLGINPKRIRGMVCVVAVMMTAAIISFTGVIGFVGLAAPHIARMIIGSDHKYLLPFSAVSGALLLMTADAVGRTILQPVSIPVGIVVSFIGVPIFVHLILKERRNAY